jgi:hypothetical protein
VTKILSAILLSARSELYPWVTAVVNSLNTYNEVFLEKLTVAQLIEKFSAIYGTHEGSLPYAQEPVTGPYPQQDESSPHSISLSRILTLSSHLCLNLQRHLLFSGFPTELSYVFFICPCMLHALSISSSLICHLKYYLLKTINY